MCIQEYSTKFEGFIEGRKIKDFFFEIFVMLIEFLCKFVVEVLKIIIYSNIYIFIIYVLKEFHFYFCLT